MAMSDPKANRKVVITNPAGLHARPADLFVKTALKFNAKVTVVKGSERVDGRSILGLLTLGAADGTELTLEAEGPDAGEALEALAELVASNFADKETLNPQ